VTGRLSLAVALLVGAAVAAAAQEQVRVFKIRHRPVREATVVVEPLLSATGSILLHPTQNTLTVRDEGEVVERVARELERWDVPPAAYLVDVRLFLASQKPLPPGPGFGPPSGVDEAIMKLWKYKSLEEIGAVTVSAQEDSPVEAALAGEYAIRFTLRAGRVDPRRAILSRLEFSRRTASANGAESLEPLIRGSVSVKLGQTAVLGATPSETAERALFLVLAARRGERR